MLVKNSYGNSTFLERLNYLFGRIYIGEKQADKYIVYQAFRYPNDHHFMRYIALLTMAPDVIVMYLLGILAVRRDLHVVGVLIGTLPCLLFNLFFRSASVAVLCYFTSYLCCFKCMKGHYWQRGLRRLRAQRTTAIVFSITITFLSTAANWNLDEIDLHDSFYSLIGGSVWGVVWWKVHQRYAPNIYTSLSKHWILEILMFRNTCWIPDLTAFECHYEMKYFRKFVDRDQSDMTLDDEDSSSQTESNVFDYMQPI